MHYELMAHADEGWWDVASKTGNNILVGVRDLAWSTYTVVAELITTVVYHMFNVDLLQMLMPNLSNFASSTSGQIINNLLVFGMAFVGVTITIRGFMKQDWGAFFKILLLTLISLTLLFSIQSERFNYIGLVDGISKDIENTLIATPPSLITGQEVNYGTTDTAINMENRIYNSLLLQPYLDLQYGDTSISRIDAEREEGYQVYDYLNASPFTEDGQDTRADIAEVEFEDMENNNVNSANASTQIGKVFMYFISLVVQGFIYIVLAAIRYMLQIGMIIALVMLPIVLFLSLISSFEKIVLGYTRKVFQLILYKAILVFYMIFVMSIMQITYTIQNYGMIQAIVFQVVLAISCIMIYFYRNSALDTVSDSSSVSPSEASGQGFGQSMNNLGNRMKSTVNRQSGSKEMNAKDFKESKQRGSQNKFKEGAETGNTQSSVRRNTNQNDNQDMNSQQNQRDNVTNFSDYQDKKKQQEEQTQKQEDTVRSNQNENSQFNANEQSDMRRSDKYKTGTEDMTTNRNENQQQQMDRQQSDSRNVESASYRSEQTAKDNHINTTDNKQRLNNEQNNRSNNTQNEQTTSTARNSANNKFEKNNQTTHSPSKQSDRKPPNKNLSNARNSKNHEVYSSPLPGSTNTPNNKKLSALRNSKNNQSKSQENTHQRNKPLNKKSAMNRSDRYSNAKQPSLNQSQQKNQPKKQKHSPQRKAQMLNRQQKMNPSRQQNPSKSNIQNQNPKIQQPKNQTNIQKQQQRKNRHIKSHVQDSINEQNSRVRPVQPRKQPQPPKEKITHQKVDMSQQQEKTSSKKTTRTTDRQKRFNEFKNK